MPASSRLRRLFALLVVAGAAATCCFVAMLLLDATGGTGHRHAVPAEQESASIRNSGPWMPLYRKRSELRPQPLRQLLPYISDSCSGRVPCISFGTPLWHRWRLWLQELDLWASGDQAACGVPCDLVSDPSAADAVLFHGRDLGPQPELRRHPQQRWVYVNQESPIATRRYGYDVSVDPKYRLMFNWSATPLLTSSTHLPYGSWEPRQHLLEGPMYSPSSKQYMAFAVFSNCKNSFNNRTAKVLELQKYMEVHVYGNCGDRALVKNFTVFQQLSKMYRFYLSFENALCRDYITEKFHLNGLAAHAVPVAFGGLSRSDYEKVSPPHSFIYGLDFSSIKQLADHLIQVAADEPRYAEYFAWKQHYRASGKATIICSVCRKLHSNRGDQRVAVADLKDYYDIKANCRPTDYQYLL